MITKERKQQLIDKIKSVEIGEDLVIYKKDWYEYKTVAKLQNAVSLFNRNYVGYEFSNVRVYGNGTLEAKRLK